MITPHKRCSAAAVKEHSQEPRLGSRQGPVPIDQFCSGDISAGDAQRHDLAREEGEHESASPYAEEPRSQARYEG